MTHTPAPWILERQRSAGVDTNFVWRIADNEGYTITRFTGNPKDPFSQDGANAKLISQAPALLAALIGIIERNDSQAWIDGKAAINRATGKE